jgi:tetratricopeptide (TPR) repeat protein
MTQAGRLNLARKALGSVRFRLLALAVLGTTLAFLSFRAFNPPRERAPSSPQPILKADVPLGTPPPLPSDDRLTVQAGLRQVHALQAEARAKGNDPAAHLRAAQAATPVGDLLSARNEICAAIALNSQPAPPLIVDVLARCEAQLGLLSEAQNTYRDLIGRVPDDAIGYIGLSRVQYLRGQRQEALGTLERGVRAVPPGDLRGRLALVSEFEARAEIQRALAEAQAISSAAPGEPLAGVKVARLLSKLGRLSEARARLERILAAHPDTAEALSTLADLRLNPLLPQNDPASVEQTLLLAGQHSPNEAASYIRLGGYYQEQGLPRQAAYVYTRMLTLVPDSAVGRLQLAYAYARLGERQRGAEQEQIARRLLARDSEETRLITRRDAHPADASIRLALAHHYIRAGQFARALIELQAACCLSPNSASALHELAAFYERLGVPPSTSPAEFRS